MQYFRNLQGFRLKYMQEKSVSKNPILASLNYRDEGRHLLKNT